MSGFCQCCAVGPSLRLLTLQWGNGHEDPSLGQHVPACVWTRPQVRSTTIGALLVLAFHDPVLGSSAKFLRWANSTSANFDFNVAKCGAQWAPRREVKGSEAEWLGPEGRGPKFRSLFPL